MANRPANQTGLSKKELIEIIKRIDSEKNQIKSNKRKMKTDVSNYHLNYRKPDK